MQLSGLVEDHLMSHDKIFNQVALCICNKSEELTHEECFEVQNGLNPICSKRCRIYEKTFNQLQYVTSSKYSNTFLKACPGSGKTEVVALKTAYEMKQWDYTSGSGIAVLTFTKNASDVIKKRIGEFSVLEHKSFPHFIGTIDGWLLGYIANPYAHTYTDYNGIDGDHSLRLVDNTSTADFLNAFKTKYAYAKLGNVSANEYYFDFQLNDFVFSSSDNLKDKARNKVDLVKWQFDDLLNTKFKFWKSGFVTYQDIEFICFYLLEDKKEILDKISKRFPFIIVDECQDLSLIQLKILDLLKNAGTTLHFVGDPNQAIYEFKKVDPSIVLNHVQEKQFDNLLLNENFRSNQEIVDLFKGIVEEDSIIGKEPKKLEDSCICLNYPKAKIGTLSNWFKEHLEQQGISPDTASIVTRGWSTVAKLRPSSNNNRLKIQERLSSAISLWINTDRQGRSEALNHLGFFIAKKMFPNMNSSKRAYYCPEIVTSHLKWRLFLSSVLKDLSANLNDFSKLWREWAKLVREQLHVILNKYRHIISDITEDFSSCSFSALSGASSQTVESTIKIESNENQSEIRTTSIHQVKGETLDAIMVVSAPSKQGTQDGYWTQWLENSTSEKARLAYVASSRPKHLLVWAVPEASQVEKSQLMGLGFKIIDLPN